MEKYDIKLSLERREIEELRRSSLEHKTWIVIDKIKNEVIRQLDEILDHNDMMDDLFKE